MNTDLAKKMIDRANKDGLNENHEMRIKAEQFEIAAKDYYENGDVKKIIGYWARARKCWCDYTGEDLI